MPDLKDLNILHLDTGREWRGGQGQVLTLAKGLRDRGVKQLLLAPHGSPLNKRAREAGIPTEDFRTRGELDFLSARNLGKQIDRSEASIVHAHDAHAHAAAWMATRRRPRVRLVVSRRVDFEVSGNFLSRRKYLDPRVHYFAISTGVRDVLLRGGVAGERVTVVPSGVDPSRFTFDVPREKLRREFGIEPEAPVIGTIGSLVDHKDHLCLVDAAATTLERHSSARFLIVGEGEMRGALEKRIAERRLGENVILTGFRSDVETFLSGFDIFVVSSHLEGLCTSLADAMLFALPVAATRTGGVPDLVRDDETGLLVEPKDPAALGCAVSRLLDDAALARRLGEAARAHAREGFTSRSLVENTVAAYQALGRP